MNSNTEYNSVYETKNHTQKEHERLRKMINDPENINDTIIKSEKINKCLDNLYKVCKKHNKKDDKLNKAKEIIKKLWQYKKTNYENELRYMTWNLIKKDEEIKLMKLNMNKLKKNNKKYRSNNKIMNNIIADIIYFLPDLKPKKMSVKILMDIFKRIENTKIYETLPKINKKDIKKIKEGI